MDSRESLRDEAKNAEVFVHNWETGHRHSRLEYDEHRTLLVRAGVPDDEIERMRRLYERMRKYSDSFGDDEYTALWDDAELEFESGSLRILHTPGTRRDRVRFCVRRIARSSQAIAC